MTAIKPIENRRVRGVPSKQYPLNTITSHPTNTEKATDAHHCFPRSQQIGDSWFVEITFDTKKDAEAAAKLHGVTALKGADGWTIIIPHVTGLTSAEHKDIEEHRAKIVIEDGLFVWYDREVEGDETMLANADGWIYIGPLNPQPGSRDGKAKKRTRLKGEARRKRVTISVKVPQDVQEDGSGVLDDLIEAGREQWAPELGWDENVPVYYVLTAGLAKALQDSVPMTKRKVLALCKKFDIEVVK